MDGVLIAESGWWNSQDPFFTRKPLAKTASTVSESTQLGGDHQRGSDRHLDRHSEWGDRESEAGSRSDRVSNDKDASSQPADVTTCQACHKLCIRM